MDPKQIYGTDVKDDAQLTSERLSQAETFRRELQKKFPRESRTFGLEGAPRTEFTVLRTPIVVEGTTPSGTGEPIPVTYKKHLIATANGIRVLEFMEYSNGSSSYEYSEAAFQKTLQEETFRNPRLGTGLTSSPAMEDSPYYDCSEGQPERISFGQAGPYRPIVLTLGEERNAFARLRRPEEGEAQQFIDHAKEVEGIIVYSEDMKDKEKDIHTMSSVKL